MTRNRRLIYPYASGPNSFVDPTGHEITFDGDTPEVYRDLYLAISQNTLASFREIWEAAHMIAWGPEAKNPYGWTVVNIPPELKQAIAQAKQDAVSLNRPDLPLPEKLAIWERACEHLRLHAEYYPEDQDVTLKQVAESERRMTEMIAKHREKVEEKRGAAT
jgi:hypothetical protein